VLLLSNLCPVRSCQQRTFACCWRLQAQAQGDPCLGATGTRATAASSSSRRQQEQRLCLCPLVGTPTVRTGVAQEKVVAYPLLVGMLAQAKGAKVACIANSCSSKEGPPKKGGGGAQATQPQAQVVGLYLVPLLPL
jgi:hypothetical protein